MLEGNIGRIITATKAHHANLEYNITNEMRVLSDTAKAFYDAKSLTEKIVWLHEFNIVATACIAKFCSTEFTSLAAMERLKEEHETLLEYCEYTSGGMSEIVEEDLIANYGEKDAEEILWATEEVVLTAYENDTPAIEEVESILKKYFKPVIVKY